jgi:hypothetical protein
MQWSDRIAQGFSPGSIRREKCPESGTRFLSVAGGLRMPIAATPLGRHSQGVSCATPYPGLKPAKALGYSVRPFHGSESRSQMNVSHGRFDPNADSSTIMVASRPNRTGQQSRPDFPSHLLSAICYSLTSFRRVTTPLHSPRVRCWSTTTAASKIAPRTRYW